MTAEILGGIGALGRKTKAWLARPSWDRAFGLAHRADRLREALSERRYGLDYSRNVPHDELTTPFTGSLPNATAYEASSSTLLKLALSEATTLGDFDNFVDIGCGKGKICIEAHRAGRFRKTIGMDFSEDLVQIARANAARRGCVDDIEFICADAADFVLPEGSNLVYMYNPFDADLLAKFARNNMTNFLEAGSCIAYVMDLHRRTLVDLGFETVYRSQSLQVSIFRAIRAAQ